MNTPFRMKGMSFGNSPIKQAPGQLFGGELGLGGPEWGMLGSGVSFSEKGVSATFKPTYRFKTGETSGITINPEFIGTIKGSEDPKYSGKRVTSLKIGAGTSFDIGSGDKPGLLGKFSLFGGQKTSTTTTYNPASETQKYTPTHITTDPVKTLYAGSRLSLGVGKRTSGGECGSGGCGGGMSWNIKGFGEYDILKKSTDIGISGRIGAFTGEYSKSLTDPKAPGMFKLGASFGI